MSITRTRPKFVSKNELMPIMAYLDRLSESGSIMVGADLALRAEFGWFIEMEAKALVVYWMAERSKRGN